LDEIVTYPVPPTTRLTALWCFCPQKSMLFARIPLVCRHSRCLHLLHYHWRVSGSAQRKRCVDCSCRRWFKSYSLDPVPTFLVREFADLLLPFITKMVNTSLAQGRLPTSQKLAESKVLPEPQGP